MSVVAGVPQVSVLDPILFLIYINDLPLAMSHSFADMFADDTTLSTHVCRRHYTVNSQQVFRHRCYITNLSTCRLMVST